MNIQITLLLAVAAKWREWGYWSSCSVSCGGGIQRRQRGFSEGRNGAEVKPYGDEYEEKACGDNACGGEHTA